MASKSTADIYLLLGVGFLVLCDEPAVASNSFSKYIPRTTDDYRYHAPFNVRRVIYVKLY